jgi:hypothetical protein
VVSTAGKGDPVGAELATRVVLSGTAAAVPKDTTGVVEASRQLTGPEIDTDGISAEGTTVPILRENEWLLA